MKTFKAILLATILLTSVNVKAEDFFIGVSVTTHHVVPYMKAEICQAHPTYVNKFRMKENHHLYWGVILGITGYLLKNKTMMYIGGTVMFDDLIQHTLRINTPFHMLNDELGKTRMYRELVSKF